MKYLSKVILLGSVIGLLMFSCGQSPKSTITTNGLEVVGFRALPFELEEVKLLDEYENEEKLGKNKKSYTFRIIYRSLERTLTNEEIDEKHEALEKATVENYKAKIR